AAAKGRLHEAPVLRWSEEAAVTVVVAADNYPGTPRTGDPITGLDDLPGAPETYVLHAGTARDADGLLVSAGGRVLSVVATGETLAQARERVYAAVEAVELPGSHHRTDIALKAERGQVTV
ncbi:MAG TPA: phosphoribosylglycinamide synthetase C domain-containing protein, partial [Ornithinibacter sp.]|nr:phosphoribosylglycinamide synthetase C domain-containing protein [Ornithinibacter sp.]